MTSTTHRHIRHVVYNPGKFWATCTCIHFLHGNIYKHQAKVLRLMHLDLAEGTVAKLCGGLVGTVSVGFPRPSSPPAKEIVPDDCRPIPAPKYLAECVIDLQSMLES